MRSPVRALLYSTRSPVSISLAPCSRCHFRARAQRVQTSVGLCLVASIEFSLCLHPVECERNSSLSNPMPGKVLDTWSGKDTWGVEGQRPDCSFKCPIREPRISNVPSSQTKIIRMLTPLISSTGPELIAAASGRSSRYLSCFGVSDGMGDRGVGRCFDF